MTYYLVLMNGETPVAVYSYDNEDAQLSALYALSKRELCMRHDPYYSHVCKVNEVN